MKRAERKRRSALRARRLGSFASLRLLGRYNAIKLLALCVAPVALWPNSRLAYKTIVSFAHKAGVTMASNKGAYTGISKVKFSCSVLRQSA